MGKHQPTQEMRAIIEAARRRESAKANAFAGAGKTELLVLSSEALGPGGLYNAFNTAMRTDAERRFNSAHVLCLTSHGIAFRAMEMARFQKRITKRIPPRTAAQRLGFGSDIAAAKLGHLVLRTVDRYCQSLDRTILPHHAAAAGAVEETEKIAALAQDLWSQITAQKGDCPILHDYYVKMFHLSDRPLPGRPRYVFYDEAQDGSAVMVDAIQRQGIPTIWCGDRHQQLYRFRGAVNAMRQITAPEYPLTQSWRFGATIAEAANRVLARKIDFPDQRLVGNPARASRVVIGTIMRPHTCLCRTNAGLFAEAITSEHPFHVVGGLDEIMKLVQGAYSLWSDGKPQRHIEELAQFDSWQELKDYCEAVDAVELRFLARLVEGHGHDIPDLLTDLKERHTDEQKAFLVLSSIHKSKGRQWPAVRLAADFKEVDDRIKQEDPDTYDDELNLLYVALTRAQDLLVVNAVLYAFLTEPAVAA
ncbi:ATP-binding domain-containing protein [Azospirillum sp. B21]|uniref:ATP-binding domain-containing protein n=1 Tax=Azospirillum sp. B21 TaxID=2607496 RepID=UPI00165F7C17|nr:ATP-binding domain-containing protein [Azospirillum sp. B21]